MEAYLLTSPLLNLDPNTPNDKPLPVYDIYVARCINHCRWFLGSPTYITTKAIVDTGSGSSYISRKKAEEIKAEIMEITPWEVHGAGKMVINAFAKFMVRTGPIKEVTLAYILEEGSRFRYDLLLGCNWMRCYNARPNWHDNTIDLTCLKTHCSFTMHANPSSSFHSNLDAFSFVMSASSEDTPKPEDNDFADLPGLTKIDNDNESDYDADSENSDAKTPVNQTMPVNNPVSKAPQVKKKKGFGAKLKALAMKACPKVFRKKVGNPPDHKWSLNIETADNPPMKILGCPDSPPEHEAICKFINEGLEDGIIEPSDSPWSAPLILIPKKDGTLWVCVDFHALNRVTKRNAYPLPWIDDCYQNLSGAKYFILLDLKSGYWQVRLFPDSKQKSPFTCCYGHFQFTVMPFSLCNTPAIFQNMMNNILRPLINCYTMVYLDDIIVYSRTADDHICACCHWMACTRRPGS